ncbi:MAG TPA: hypothetical protein VK137_20525 [Planctomycetaceae bacterium]|nr:hypothetical protein [Planctomycetaceae bacterium]
MSVKEAVLNAVREMPDEVSFDEVLEQLEVLAAIRRADEDIAAGRVYSQEEIEQEVETWFSE